MPDRLAEIRVRLDALAYQVIGTNERMVWDGDKAYHMEDDHDRASQAFHRHAPADIAWLLAALESEQRHSAMLVERIDGHLLENVRLLSEVERLRGNEPVAQDVTKLECSDE